MPFNINKSKGGGVGEKHFLKNDIFSTGQR